MPIMPQPNTYTKQNALNPQGAFVQLNSVPKPVSTPDN